MLNRLAIIGLVIAALAAPSTARAAPFLAGGFSMSSLGAGPGLTPIVPIDPTGAALTSFLGATALDFTTTGSATPGVVGAFRVDSTAGDFNALYGLTGEIKDFTFSGAAQTHYPVPPIVGFEFISSPVFSFDLLSVGGSVPGSNLLTLTGSGLFHLAGFADTPGTFYLSANEAGGTLSFSASHAAVPEPGSLTLLGLGLFGLAGATRRRVSR